MSSKKSESPIHIEPRGSRQLALALLLVHAAAMAVVINLGLPPWASLALAGSVVMSLYMTFSTQVLGRGRSALTSLVWDEEGDWTLMDSLGERLQGRLRPNSYVHPRLLILNFIIEGKPNRSLVLMRDSLDPRTFHRLLMRLNLEGGRSRSGD